MHDKQKRLEFGERKKNKIHPGPTVQDIEKMKMEGMKLIEDVLQRN